MKKITVLFLLIAFCISCGPHRMACGPKGICKTSTSKNQEKAA